MSKFPSRKLTKNERWTKKCKLCKYFVPDEYSYCDRCLLQTFAAGDLPEIIGGCEHEPTGYLEEQVTLFLRRAIGETVVRGRERGAW